MRRCIIRLMGDTFGVYVPGRRGPFGTSLVHKGSLEECLAYKVGR